MRCLKQLARLLAMLAIGPVLAIAAPGDGNRLAYLDDPVNPYYVGLNFPKLTTPMWVGEEGVEAVVILAIDDMGEDTAKYERMLRPILDRLKQIDGRAPVSIMANRVNPDDHQLQTWLKEGLSIECHTLDHPCPLWRNGDFKAAQDTYHGSVDLISKIPNNTPVAFRMPCCDSINSVSPRFFAELFNHSSPDGRFLSIDSSVFCILTPDDPDLPRELVFDPDGRERFRKYLPSKSFVNTIENYPYPYVIGNTCWEFPCIVPSDWEAQNLHGPNNPKTVEDMKAALDAIVIKQGVMNLVFHPHGWIKPEQVVELIDHATAKYGGKVKFLNFREAFESLNLHLLNDRPLRVSEFDIKSSRHGGPRGVRVMDVNNDGFLDVVCVADGADWSRVWSGNERTWHEVPFPAGVSQIRFNEDGTDIAWGVIHPDGRASMIHQMNMKDLNGVCILTPREGAPPLPNVISVGLSFSPRDRVWLPEEFLFKGLRIDGRVVSTSRANGAQFHLRDIDGDGLCEGIAMGGHQFVRSVFSWSPELLEWSQQPFGLPGRAAIAPEYFATDSGTRLVDLNEDGRLDILHSDTDGFGIYMLVNSSNGWQRTSTGQGGSNRVLSEIARDSDTSEFVGYAQNNGFWTHSRQLWWQNEDTADLPDHVRRVSFNDLLKDVEPRPKSPEASLKSIKIRPGYQAELVVSEPLTMDPVAFDWDERGRLWVVEMADYPLGEDGKGKPCGRVRVIEDADNDGKYDKSTIFLEGLSYPNSVMCWRNGVIISCAPDVFYAEDTNGDNKADTREVLLTGFDISNPQHRVNGFALGLDGWIYAADGQSQSGITVPKTGKTHALRDRDFRFKPDTGDFELCSGQGQFGRSRDDWGNWFANNNSVWAWHIPIDDSYLKRNPHLGLASPVQVVDSDRRLYPISPILARFNDLDNAGFATSACSPAPYRDELFGPWFENNLFVCEPVHNLVHRVVLEPDGASFKGHRAPGEEQSEFLASSDNFSRFVQVKTGPDGALWIADMYRQHIEHPEWIPDDWEAKIDLRAGHDKGRIYRVFPVGTKPRPIQKLAGLNTAELVAAMDTPNGPQRDMAMRLLLHKGDKSAAYDLAKLATKAARPQVRLQALATLRCLNVLASPTLKSAILRFNGDKPLGDPHPEVRRFAVEIAGALAGESDRFDEMLEHAVIDQSPRVRLGVALALGGRTGDRATPGQLIAWLLKSDQGNPWIRAAALSSAASHAGWVLTQLCGEMDPRGLTSENLDPLLPLVFDGGERQSENVALLMRVLVPNEPPSDFTATRVIGLDRLLRAADRKGITLEKLVTMLPESDRDATRQAVNVIVDYARKLAQTDSEALHYRIGALKLISRPEVWDANSRDAINALLEPRVRPDIQRAAVDALVRADGPSAVDGLLKRWKAFGPRMRGMVLDTFLSSPATLSKLLDAVDAGTVAPAEFPPSIRQALLSSRDPQIKERAERLFAANSNRADVLDQYRLALTEMKQGDAGAGRLVFEKTCAVCHQLQGIGTEVGPNLAALTDRSMEAMLTAILDPNRVYETQFTEYAVALKDGRVLSGLIAAETANNITLRRQEGKEDLILRSDIEELSSAGRSFMPEGLEKDLSPRDVADVIAFLNATGTPPKTFEGNKPSVVRAGDDGTIRLPATAAEIYGSSLVFESKYENLGYWSSADDRAAWTFEAPEAGVYEIFTDYAAASDVSGNHFDVRVGDQSVEGIATSTGTWDDYRRRQRVGEINLVKGRNRLEVVPHGEIRGALMDLRAVILTPMARDSNGK